MKILEAAADNMKAIGVSVSAAALAFATPALAQNSNANSNVNNPQANSSSQSASAAQGGNSTLNGTLTNTSQNANAQSTQVTGNNNGGQGGQGGQAAAASDSHATGGQGGQAASASSTQNANNSSTTVNNQDRLFHAGVFLGASLDVNRALGARTYVGKGCVNGFVVHYGLGKVVIGSNNVKAMVAHMSKKDAKLIGAKPNSADTVEKCQEGTPENFTQAQPLVTAAPPAPAILPPVATEEVEKRPEAPMKIVHRVQHAPAKPKPHRKPAAVICKPKR